MSAYFKDFYKELQRKHKLESKGKHTHPVGRINTTCKLCAKIYGFKLEKLRK